ncbi:MAG: type IV pilus secretin PilQ [Gammaproteobacteria bacterium]|nr:type IV pilus secretin PilQ [Gammaproteobacteria bacterium]MCW8987800.1 type IV pilus secretin PilQ [Gammaproteobacteria bacterium]
MKNITFNLSHLTGRQYISSFVGACMLIVAAMPSLASTEENAITEINYSSLPGDQVQIRMSLENLASEPGSFTIDNPARIAFDFPNTKVKLAERSQNIGIGVARSIKSVEAGGRTRVVINLSRLVTYNTTVDGNDVIVTLGGTSTNTATKSSNIAGLKTGTTDKNIKNIDFRRGEKGEGRVIINLADPNTPVDLKTRGEQITVTITDSTIASELERRLDVIDFGTPVKSIDSFNQNGNVKIIITGIGEFEQLAYQADNSFTVDVKPIVKESAAEKQKKKFAFKGERLSLNFQNIEVRAVLQLIADFTDLNLITSDTVTGNVTLRLKNVPWDQALDIILRSKGLAMVKDGNVISVAPAEEVAARAKLDQTIEAQAPLISDSIQINYAKAADFTKLLKTKDNSLLSERGSVSVDGRTNKLLIRDTAKNITAITELVQQLDIPVRQVLVESRIVLATNDFSKELGVRFGISSTDTQAAGTSTDVGAISGSLTATDQLINGTTLTSPARYNVDLPASLAGAGTIGIALARLPFGTLLDLELSAAQTEGRSETISSPRVITSDQSEATIETGTEIPYSEASSSGAATVSFKKAVLSLKVTPQITPDDRIIMNLAVNKDSPDFANITAGVPPIKTQAVKTNVLVDNGETIVLGGVYEQTKANNVTRVPFFGDLPLVGWLFRNKFEQNNKSELLIFVTPKLLKDNAKL